METKDKLILALLVLAILFSIFSMVISFSIGDVQPTQPVKQVIVEHQGQLNPTGQVSLFIEGGEAGK